MARPRRKSLFTQSDLARLARAAKDSGTDLELQLPSGERIRVFAKAAEIEPANDAEASADAWLKRNAG